MNIDTTNTNRVIRTSSALDNTSRTPNNVVSIKQGIVIDAEVSNPLPSLNEIAQAVESVNRFTQQSGRNLEFALAENSGRVVITVREAETGNIIRQIPPEEVVAIAELISENLNKPSAPLGVLITDKV